MNPKRLAFWRAFFVLRPPTKDRKCNNAIFYVFTLKQKKNMFSPVQIHKNASQTF